MTATQVSTDRTRDRQVTQFQSALQAVREQVGDDPPKMGRSTKRRFFYHQQHGFDIDLHVSLVPDWKAGCRVVETIDAAINMAIGTADRLDERGEYDYSPRIEGRVTVRIIARIARD